jgi:hypothetical protein
MRLLPANIGITFEIKKSPVQKIGAEWTIFLAVFSVIPTFSS